MKINEKASLEVIGDETFVFVNGSVNVDSTKVVRLNASSAWLWNELFGKEFSREEAVAALMGHYDAPEEVIAADVDRWISVLSEQGVIAG